MPTKNNLTWQALTLMAFTAVWGFGNVVNGYANQGLHIVVSWILMFRVSLNYDYRRSINQHPSLWYW